MVFINKYDFLEKLKASKYYYADDEYKSGYNDGIFHAEVTVEHVPPYNAIPVSFILDKMSVINSEYINVNRQIDREPRSADGLTGIATNLLHEYNTLRNLIKEWEGK